jgi:hypothetical protein
MSVRSSLPIQQFSPGNVGANRDGACSIGERPYLGRLGPSERTIRVLQDAIRDPPDEVISLGEFHSAKELFVAEFTKEQHSDLRRSRLKQPSMTELV